MKINEETKEVRDLQDLIGNRPEEEVKSILKNNFNSFSRELQRAIVLALIEEGMESGTKKEIKKAAGIFDFYNLIQDKLKEEKEDLEKQS